MALAPSSFAAAPSGPSAKAAKRRYGAIVTYALSEPAKVSFTVLQPQTGRRTRSGRCVKSSNANRRGRRCTRLVALRGSFVLAGVAGSNHFRFTGRLAGRTLPAGSFRLVATPGAGGGPEPRSP